MGSEDYEIEVMGQSGVTERCLEAIRRLIQCGDTILIARLLTAGDVHAFLLELDQERLVFVRSGFTTGYAGEGSRGLGQALALLETVGAEIKQHRISPKLLERGNRGQWSFADVQTMRATKVENPLSWLEWRHATRWVPGWPELWGNFPLVIPYGLLAPELMATALELPKRGGDALRDAYAQLELRIRALCGNTKEFGVRLMEKAFLGKEPLLRWVGEAAKEQEGRGGLFLSTFKVFRNPRAHEVVVPDLRREIQELMVLNQLWIWLGEVRPVDPKTPQSRASGPIFPAHPAKEA